MPHDIDFRQKGVVSRHLVRLGFVTEALGDRKYVRRPDRTPPREAVEAVLSGVDREIRERLGIATSTAPEWMSEGDIRDLSYLEHAALLLCDGRSRPRAALFPGHPDPDWQRSVMGTLQAEGLVETTGEGFFKSYAGSAGAEDKLLDRGFLLGTFWRRQDPRAAEEGGPNPDDGDPAPDGDSGAEEREEEDLRELVGEMYAVLESHAKTIRELKATVKELKARMADMEGKDV